jgi:hypothetical protein
MPHYNDVYISQQDFEICLHHGMRYDGFVEGVGYAYSSNFTIPPVHFQKYNPPGRVHDDESFFQNGFIQYLDTSPEMRLMSVKYQHKVKSGDTLTSISAKYGVSIQSIMDANSGIDWEGERRGDRIFAGEELELPNEAKENHSENSKSEGFVSGNPFLGPTVARANFEQRLSAELYSGDNAQSQRGGFGNVVSGVGLGGAVASNIDGTFRLAKSGKFSLGYYASGWKGNQYVKATYSVSKAGARVSTGVCILSTGMAYNEILSGNSHAITYADAAIGSIGLSSSLASYYSGIQIPVIGFFVAIYGSARLGWDLGASLAPKYGLINGYYWDRNKHLRHRKSIL